MGEQATIWWHSRHWDLPPLILHPFNHGVEVEAAIDSIQVSLHQSGTGEAGQEKEPLFRGRYMEFRMLCFTGKDVMRWIAQCVDFARRDPVLAKAGIQPQSFSDLLVNRTPPAVGARFESWGVIDYRRVLKRAIGVNAVFPTPPDYAVVASEFLENYYAYADALFAAYEGLTAFTPLESGPFVFSLYTSDEYMASLGYMRDDQQG